MNAQDHMSASITQWSQAAMMSAVHIHQMGKQTSRTADANKAAAIYAGAARTSAATASDFRQQLIYAQTDVEMLRGDLLESQASARSLERQCVILSENLIAAAEEMAALKASHRIAA